MTNGGESRIIKVWKPRRLPQKLLFYIAAVTATNSKPSVPADGLLFSIIVAINESDNQFDYLDQQSADATRNRDNRFKHLLLPPDKNFPQEMQRAPHLLRDVRQPS